MRLQKSRNEYKEASGVPIKAPTQLKVSAFHCHVYCVSTRSFSVNCRLLKSVKWIKYNSAIDGLASACSFFGRSKWQRDEDLFQFKTVRTFVRLLSQLPPVARQILKLNSPSGREENFTWKQFDIFFKGLLSIDWHTLRTAQEPTSVINEFLKDFPIS